MKQIFIALLGFFLFSIMNLQAQNEDDAVRMSQYSIFGTASYVGRAGAIGALGGDFTSASYNPAGLGVYTKSEFLFTPSISDGYTNTSYYGEKASDFRVGFSPFPMGFVFNYTSPKESSYLRSIQFAFGANSLKSNSNRIDVVGTNLTNSMMDTWVNDANAQIDSRYGLDPIYDLNLYGSYLAWDTYVMDSSAGVYTSPFQIRNATERTVNQIKNQEEYGGITEMVFSASTNLNDFLYLGATLGVPFYDYTMHSSYEEYTNNDSYIYNQNLSTEGVGINLKLGAIVRPLDWLRVGVAFHTPTYYALTDLYETNMSHGPYYQTSPETETDYAMTTPYKVLGNLGIVLGNQTSPIAGSIGFDYEYSDYSTMHYYMDDTWYKNDINNWMNEGLQGSHTFKVGGTLNLQQFVIRGGYAYATSPYKDEYYNVGAQTTITGGVGYRSRFWYVDFAYANTYQSKTEYLYSDEFDSSKYNLQKYTNLFVATLGFRF